MTLPGTVATVCARFLATAPAALVTGLYLRGGLGFGEWFEGQSDIDFVATLSHRPTPAEVRDLRATHAALLAAYPRSPFSGVHVLAEDLAADPRDCPPVPVVLDGRFEGAGHLDEVVAWHELAWHGVTVTGPDHRELGVWTDADVLHDFTRGNLDTYWRDQVEQVGRAVRDRESAVVAEWRCAWCALGAPRLHHLTATGEMTAKSAAGRWALAAYPGRFAAVLDEALRIRESRPGPSAYAGDPARRAADTLAVLEHAVAEGTR